MCSWKLSGRYRSLLWFLKGNRLGHDHVLFFHKNEHSTSLLKRQGHSDKNNKSVLRLRHQLQSQFLNYICLDHMRKLENFLRKSASVLLSGVWRNIVEPWREFIPRRAMTHQKTWHIMLLTVVKDTGHVCCHGSSPDILFLCIVSCFVHVLFSIICLHASLWEWFPATPHLSHQPHLPSLTLITLRFFHLSQGQQLTGYFTLLFPVFYCFQCATLSSPFN